MDHWSGLINTTDESITIDLKSPTTSTFKAHFKVKDSTTNIEDINVLKQYVQITPNPVINELFINVALPKPEFINIVLFDSSGKIVQQNTNISQEILKEQIKLDMSLLPRGAYWVRVRVGAKELVEQVVKL